MVVQRVTAASTTSVSVPSAEKTKVVETDSHTLILKQIAVLQKQLKGLYEELAKTPPNEIDKILDLQKQIEGVKDQLSALQTALITTENKKVQVRQKVEDKAHSTQATNTTGKDGDKQVTDFSVSLTPSAYSSKSDSSSAAQSSPPLLADDTGNVAYTSSGESDIPSADAVGINIDVTA